MGKGGGWRGWTFGPWSRWASRWRSTRLAQWRDASRAWTVRIPLICRRSHGVCIRSGLVAFGFRAGTCGPLPGTAVARPSRSLHITRHTANLQVVDSFPNG